MTESRHSFQGRLIGFGRSQGATDVGVVVVTYHSASTIERCLKELLGAKSITRIVVVDNASGDDTCERVRVLASRDSRLQLVRNSENSGYAAACNQGASALDTPWVAFVNPDCYVEANTLSRLVSMGIQRAGAGMLGVELVDVNGVSDPSARRRDPSLREWLARLGKRDDLYLGRDPRLDLQPVEALSGALMLMPLGLFLRLEGFDETYRLHVEDIDLCRRVREHGYEVLVANDIRVVHVRGVSSRTRPVWVEWQKHRSLWRYFQKFEAAQTDDWLKPLLWLGLWSHCLWAAARVTLTPRISGSG
ncbi:glycosyltransferase family 2 protein [Arenimonas oryziterrae]|uniref:Glycosyltransferase 2-like domain-containing protein n=1 Tax=Arenimonas oryziterrae DSM 21050 = YC6267 TaxID=1121015 RepID=A0A091ASL0_9GAMM|nr:glycosyltransferase family 2 protein [Arenimonas oryziterrae]KFN43178.1 hypothetical protein N789_11490 [Arenimonas oryziterrae DSM 21050 = YC6267]